MVLEEDGMEAFWGCLPSASHGLDAKRLRKREESRVTESLAGLRREPMASELPGPSWWPLPFSARAETAVSTAFMGGFHGRALATAVLPACGQAGRIKCGGFGKDGRSAPSGEWVGNDEGHGRSLGN